MTLAWQGKVGEMIDELHAYQERMCQSPGACDEDDPREQFRKIIGYLRNNQARMQYTDIWPCRASYDECLDGVGGEGDQLSDERNGDILEHPGWYCSDSSDSFGSIE